MQRSNRLLKRRKKREQSDRNNLFYFLTFDQGLAAAVQLNQYLEENAIIQLDQKAGKDQGKFQVISGVLVKFTLSMMQVNFKKLENSVKDRVTQYVTLQHSGDKEAVDK